MGRLTVSEVRSAGPGKHGDGDGLYLLVKPTGLKSWVLRVQSDGKRRDVGLGSVSISARAGASAPPFEVPLLQRKHLMLAEAREKAVLLRQAAKGGMDPVVERDRDRRGVPNFGEAAKAAYEALKGGWATKNGEAFIASLKEHAFPKLGSLRVDQINSPEIQEVLEPIWLKIPVMAKKVRQRISTVLNFANSKRWRASEAPGKSVTVGLPKQPSGGNFKAMPYVEVPAFVADVSAKFATSGRTALLFQILTAARPGEVRGARWRQVDLKQRNWNRPSRSTVDRRATGALARFRCRSSYRAEQARL